MNEVQKTAWYEKTGLLVVLLIVFFPVGLYGVWKNTRFTTKTKGIITGVVAVVFIVVMTSGGGGTKTGGGTSDERASAPSAAPSAQPMWSNSGQEYDACARSFNSFDAAAGARLCLSTPLQSDGQYYQIIGELERKDGKYYIAKRAGSRPPDYFSFKLHKKMSTPPFSMNRMFNMVGRFVDVEEYRTVSGQKKMMPVFEAVCFRIY